MSSSMIFITMSVINLAFTNETNNNFKHIGAIHKSQTINKKNALIWATITTLLGVGHIASQTEMDLKQAYTSHLAPKLNSLIIALVGLSFLNVNLSLIKKKSKIQNASPLCIENRVISTKSQPRLGTQIAALLIIIDSLLKEVLIVTIGMAATLGSIFMAYKVVETLSHQIISMINDARALSGNLATCGLVFSASHLGLPSITQIFCGVLSGIDAVTKLALCNSTFKIFLSWIITLPTKAILGSLFSFSSIGEFHEFRKIIDG